MTQEITDLGIIAGNRTLPLTFARLARSAGVKRLIAAAFENETSPELASLVDDIVWMRVGQLGKLIDTFKDRGIKKCVMVGQIAPKNLFDLRPDMRAMMLLMRLKEKNAHTIFGAIADELKKEGIELIEATPWLKPIIPSDGFLVGRRLSDEQTEDVRFGYRIAKAVSRLDIGQSVVVKDGVVLAVEAFEGTDACLIRGGSLAAEKGGAIAIKVAKENHDMRFDIPCIGLTTIRTCIENKFAALAIESNRTLILDYDDVIETVKKNKFTLLTISEVSKNI
ncbi:MAG: UDP-2,3-diacylglucosamine diphosphatase LpxI [Verrucomicrobiae bacterium]|nr:UDP-2,3-diacylglucosamine diphosphatase LpxI [Verrucomicrobiae bacterium]